MRRFKKWTTRFYLKRGIASNLKRPDTRNPLGHTGDGERFKSIVSEANSKNLGCIIMTGNGKAFSAGGDLKSMKKNRTFWREPLQLRDHYRKAYLGLQVFMEHRVPLVGAINEYHWVEQ